MHLEPQLANKPLDLSSFPDKLTIVSDSGITKLPLQLYTANTPVARMTGFRWQKRIPPQGTGIWLKDSKSSYSLWMKDVPFDLDAIGFDGDMNVVDLKRLTALSTVPVAFSSDVKSVVEVPAGWCLRNGIRKGFRAIPGDGAQ